MRLEHKPKNERTFKRMSRKALNYIHDKKAPMITGLVIAGLFTLGSIIDATKPKSQKDTVCTCTQTTSCTQTIREGDTLPLIFSGKSFREMESVNVTKVDEKGIDLSMNFEVFMSEMADGKARVEYGKSLRIGEGALVWEVKAEKGKDSGEAVVTVKTTSLCDSDCK